MTIPKNILKEHIDKAISEVNESQIPNQRHSRNYILVVDSKELPPKYVISIANKYANGLELESDAFNAIEAKNYLIKNGYEIIYKKMNVNNSSVNVWIEKTIISGRKDRIEGNRALGRAIWSPQKSKNDADIYKNMKLVQKGDIIIHLVDNKYFSGVSYVKEKAIESVGISGTDWDGPAFLITLEEYTTLNPVIDRAYFLSERNKILLEDIARKSEVFYNKKLDLRQGAYLTPCPLELLFLLNETYKTLSSNDLPLIENISLKSAYPEQNNLFNSKELNKILNNKGLKISNTLLFRYITSLLTKPFVILTGLSGSGKTKLAQAFAKWICADESQYKLIPVGADWTNREPLLGYPNALKNGEYVLPENGAIELILSAQVNPEKPYFLILDEMNLSHVERYFADFLSAMESGEVIALHPDSEDWGKCKIPPKITLPKNIFVVGTVNIDETTYMFSPKVLDRASVIEFRVSEEEMAQYLDDIKPLDLDKINGLGAEMAASFIELAKNKAILPKDLEKLSTTLVLFFKELKKTGTEFGYRTASEINRFAAVANELDPTWTMNQIIDCAIVQKLLPKLHGSRNKLSKVLPILGGFCLEKNEKIKENYFEKLDSIQFNSDPNIKYKISFEKICRMYKNAVENGYASYAEA